MGAGAGVLAQQMSKKAAIRAAIEDQLDSGETTIVIDLNDGILGNKSRRGFHAISTEYGGTTYVSRFEMELLSRM